MIVEIDEHSGFCFGVVNAIQKAENVLNNDKTLFCLGDIVHNHQEVQRLSTIGLKTINHEQFLKLKDTKVLLRAHGEPPSTYISAQESGITLIDATCPVVLRLQKKIKNIFLEIEGSPASIVIFGKRGHAEVIGLVGQTNGEAIIIEKLEEIDVLDFEHPIFLFSQTTMAINKFTELISAIQLRMKKDVRFEYYDTICRQVANKIPHLRSFAEKYDLVFFVSDSKSSNGKALYEECKQANENTYFISSTEDINDDMLNASVERIGICGATSTPSWLMDKVKLHIMNKAIDNRLINDSEI